MKATSSLHRFLLVTGSLIAFATTIYAETTWIGSVDNNWHNQDNWSNGLPGVGTMNGGTANASAEIRIGDAAIGSFTMNDGILNASARIAISENGGTGTFNIHGGTVNHTTGDIFVGLRNDSSGTLNIHGGTLTTSSLIAGHTNGTGTVNMYGGSLTGGSINIGDWNGSPSTFNMYSGAQVHSEDRIRIGRQSVGTFRAWLDGSEFNPMTGDGTLILNDQNQTAHLDVALVGGVMLSGHSSFDLIDAADGQAGNWVSTPNASLWATDSLAGQVTVSLASAANLGTLDAGDIGNTIGLTTASSIGFIELSNVDPINPLQLRLGIDEDSISGSNFADFIFDLAAAGYSPIESIANAVDIMFDPELNGAEYFAWDLTAYTDNPTLAINSVTVIPEPSTALMASLMIGLGLLRRRRK